MRLILFDIDGTLIHSNQAGRLALGVALEQVFGTRGELDIYDMSGKTDLRIVTDLLSSAGVAAETIRDNMSAFFNLMATRAQEIFPLRGIQPCPGTQLLLQALRQREGVIVGLLTGNATGTAPLKLAAAGIEVEQFLVGAYGCEAYDRNELPALAIHRAIALTGVQITGDNVVIVGDTPADIACARAGKARAIAVATGGHATDVLQSYDPDHVLPDLSDTLEVLRLLLA